MRSCRKARREVTREFGGVAADSARLDESFAGQVVRHAFTSYVKARAGNHLEHDERRDFRTAKEFVAGAVCALQAKSLKGAILDATVACSSPALPWLVLEWSWDTTPERARRVVCLDQHADVSRVLNGSREHLIQSGTIGLPRSMSEEIIVAPLIIDDNAAGTICAALQRRWEQIGVHPLQLAAKGRLVLMSICIDAHSANLKLCRFFRGALPQHLILHVNLCVLHALARANEGINNVIGLSGSIYSLSKLMCIDMYFERMVRAACRLVRSSRPLVWDGVRPPPEHFRRSRTIILMCCGGIDIAKPAEDLCDRGRRLKLAAQVLNGNWRSERPEHFCHGCCSGPEGAVNRMVRAACDLLCATKPPIAAAHRWGKQLPSASWWLLGVLVHNLLPRSFAAPSDERDDDPGEHNPMFELICRSFLGQAGADAAVDMSAARDELRRRRAAGHKILNTFEDVFYLAVNVVAMTPLQRMTLGSYGKSYEGQRKRMACEPEFYETVQRARSVMLSQSFLLQCDPAASAHDAESSWSLLPWVDGFEMAEEWRLRMRSAILIGAALVVLAPCF